MENLNKYTTQDFENLIQILMGKLEAEAGTWKIEDILFDKGVTLVKDKKNKLSFVEEEGVDLSTIKMALALLDVGKPGILLGIQWTKANKKPYKLVQVAKLAGTKFVLADAIEAKSITGKDILQAIEETIPGMQDMSKTDAGLRALTSTAALPRVTNEILGILHFEHGISTTAINKALNNLPEEITRNPVTTLLRINSYLYEQGLNTWMNHSPKVMQEIGYISSLRYNEQQQMSQVFQGALGMIDDKERRDLAAYVFTAHPDKITKLSGLLEDIFNFAKTNGAPQQAATRKSSPDRPKG